MHDKSAPNLDRRLAQLAARQHNLVTTRQLRRLGFSRQQTLDRARAGRLHPIHRGVYAVGTPKLTRGGWYLAAVLACGSGAVLSHASAGAHLRIREAPLSPVHVTVPGRNGRRRRPGIVIHRPRGAIEQHTRHGIPTTTPARTLMDLSHDLTPRQLERALDEAHHLTLLHQPSLQRLLRDHPRRSARLKRALPKAGTTRTKSQNEERFLAWLRRHGLPVPLLNARIHGVEVDALYPEQRLIVEIDPWHTHERRFHRDRERDRRHLAAGYVTFRIPDDQLTVETAGELRRSLASRAGVSSSTDAKKPPTSSIR
jgi:very-short-patch-repair endonuclease